MLDAIVLQDELRQCTGTEKYYQHALLRKFKYTDGVRAMAEGGGAYWLIDLVASYQPRLVGHMKIPFQLWTFKKNETGNGAVVTCKEDSDEPELVRQKIPFTDFPLDEINLYVEGDVLLLPSEH